MTRALIVTNPAAARAHARGLKAAWKRLERGGLKVDVEQTLNMGDGATLARAAVADGIGVVVAHGGDGTAMDVAAGLVGTGLPLGLLPGGTGNVLAGNLGVSRSFVAAADTIVQGCTRTIDLGRLTTAAGSRFFAVSAATGFAADLMATTEQRHKQRFGVSAYVVRAAVLAMDLVRARSHIEVDGVVHEGHAATVLVANCGQIVPGVLPLGSHILPDDGVLDVVVIDATSYAAALRVAWRLLLRRPQADAAISFYRGASVRVVTEPAMPVQSDGDALGVTPLVAELVPHALDVYAPRPRRAVWGNGAS